jgi:crotonobetainyl-CoA:carnitine CoA-transferase CaiB-like acyl-CoA transferase
MKLEGVRVLDLSLFLPGPAMTQVMADHGAEVIKLEPLPHGEPNREIGLERDGVSVFFANTHRAKRSIGLNLKTDAGREALLRLAESCDVMVEAFRPGVVKRLGVDYEAVCARNPRIVYVSISAYGQTGPYVTKPAHDAATEAMAGILSVNLGQDDKPWLPAIANADMLSSLHALCGVLMALLRRERTGKGDYLDVAMMDSLLAAMPNNLGPPMAEKRAPVAKNERSWGGNAMYRPYETSDGRWIVLGGSEMKFAENLLGALGRPDLVPLCEPPPGPNQDPVKTFLAEIFATRTQAEWIEWFEGRDVCFAPVKSLREALDDPHVRAREMVVVDDRGWEHVGIPAKFRDEPGQVRFDLPARGEHTEAVLREIGYDDATIAAMREAGAI